MVTTQAVIAALTLFKHNTWSRFGWRRSQLGSLIIRDGALTFLIVLGKVLSTLKLLNLTAIPGFLFLNILYLEHLASVAF